MHGGIIYSRTTAGHKRSYAETLEKIFAYRAVHGESNVLLITRLVRAPRLIFSTLDDAYATFFLVAGIRWLLGARTVGLFLRPQTCNCPKNLRTRAKSIVFRAIRRFHIADVLVIVPFEAEPRNCQISSGWVYDPEFWDLDLKLSKGRLPSTSYSDEIASRAKGRGIVVLPGAFTDRKGLKLLVDLLEQHAHLSGKFLFVSAGLVNPRSRALARRFLLAGGVTADRFVSDAELFSLYRIADYVWAAYEPEYDQSSGAFGRALQTSRPVIVREGSILERLAEIEKMSFVRLPFDSIDGAHACLLAAEQKTIAEGGAEIDLSGNTRRRKCFVDAINNRLSRAR